MKHRIRPAAGLPPKNGRDALWLALAGLVLAGVGGPGAADTRDEARFLAPVPWTKPNISKVLVLGYTELGIQSAIRQYALKDVGGRLCVSANVISIDVDDRYAFDVDEPVELALTYAPADTATDTFKVFWDKNGGDGHGTLDIRNEPGERLRTVKVTLDRARLAGLGAHGVDIAVGGPRGPLTLCDVAVTRSNRTATRPAAGAVRLVVKDKASGKTVPARVGLYDSTGRLPLPSEEAVLVRRFGDKTRRHWINTRTLWPSPNRQGFYVDGSYAAELPAGRYELAVTRGPEYRAHRSQVVVEPGKTAEVTVSLERFENLPAKGWYSGESHLHLGRDAAADLDAWNMVAAEDLHVANLLEMGNIAGTYFKQPAWGRAGRFEKDGYALVSGQEDPRTGHRGHTIRWNLKEKFHAPPEQFYQYHAAFEDARRQGAIGGYAHLGELFNGRRGLALDVPFGLVDFIEVHQGGRINTEIWYSFLNLGYRISPAGGADYPYFGPTLPGAERTYVKVDGPFSADAWFEGFRRGRAYVSNGPFLEFSINGRQMGEELRVPRGTRLDVAALASLNPDVDTLDRVELVVLGDVKHQVAATGSKAQLRQTLVADRSMWVAVRAYGKTPPGWFTPLAHSAPIYVVVDDEPTWKREAVPQLVQFHRNQLQMLLTNPIEPNEDLEALETRELQLSGWRENLPAIRRRVGEAEARYDELLKRHAQVGR